MLRYSLKAVDIRGQHALIGGHIQHLRTRNMLQSYALAKGTKDHKGNKVTDHKSH